MLKNSIVWRPLLDKVSRTFFMIKINRLIRHGHIDRHISEVEPSSWSFCSIAIFSAWKEQFCWCDNIAAKGKSFKAHHFILDGATCECFKLTQYHFLQELLGQLKKLTVVTLKNMKLCDVQPTIEVNLIYQSFTNFLFILFTLISSVYLQKWSLFVKGGSHFYKN